MLNIYKNDKFFDIDNKFKELLSRKEIIFETDDYTEKLKKIIEDESFVNNIKEILNSSSVRTYFEKIRRFSEKDNDFSIKFIDEIEYNEKDDILKNGFIKLKSFLKNDKNFLSKTIIFKYLPKYNRAFVDPNMRIVINPIYFEISETLEETGRNKIFQAYLFIIILHEFVHLTKFLQKEKNSFDNIPNTPKNKEGGQIFINYLFNLPKIYYITEKQASIINRPENWNNIEILSKVFEEQKVWYENYIKDHDDNVDRPSCKNNDSISFYLSLLEEEHNKINSNEIKDDWYDMD